MIAFSEFLITSGNIVLFEKTAFYQKVLNRLSPDEQEEFIEYLRVADPINIMKMIRSVHKKSNSLKGKKE